MTLEVRYTRRDQEEHNQFYREIVEIGKVDEGQLPASEPGIPDEGEGRQNMGVLRHLCLLRFYSFLMIILLALVFNRLSVLRLERM